MPSPILFSMLVAVALATPVPAFGGEEDDYEQALRLKDSGDILSLQVIVERAERDNTGRLIEAELEDEDGDWVYELEFVDERGHTLKRYYDARTGEPRTGKDD
jgi:uncharacterized membrane protein YkoI